MSDLLLILSVVLMFFLRIGIPILALVVLSVIVNRWQTQREDYIREHYHNQSQN